MKKLFFALIAASIIVSCSTYEETSRGEALVLYGYCDCEDSRTSFGTPTANKIPFAWSKGDCVWLGNFKSNPIAADCTSASFRWDETPSVIGGYHIFYNMTGTSKTANVLTNQSADGNLGNDGDFGYALADEFGTFVLSHKTSYFWFDTTTNDELPNLTSISISAPHGIHLAGEKVFNFASNSWDEGITNGSSTITLSFGEEGRELNSSNEGVMATAVALPAAIGGKELTISYTFADGRTFTETKTPSKDLEAGAVRRIATKIAASDLPDYTLRVLTFEDKDKQFEEYRLDYVDDWSGREIVKWSDLIDTPQYGGPMLYGNGYTTMGFSDAAYYWYDEGNTELYHMFPDNGFAGMENYNFASGGHAISNYWGAGYTDEDRNIHVAKYYGQDYIDQWAGVPGADQALGWFCVQLMTPIAPHSGENFCVHYGYKDAKSFIENLPEISFGDEVARVIDHMWVTNTNYTLNQLHNGVKSEEGNTFGGNWTGLQEDAWLKLVAYGYDSFDADPTTDEPTSETEFWLVKGFNVVEDWQKWDLSVLGKVAKVRFNFLYSDDMGGKYGFTIPGYFAYDDIAVRFEK